MQWTDEIKDIKGKVIKVPVEADPDEPGGEVEGPGGREWEALTVEGAVLGALGTPLQSDRKLKAAERLKLHALGVRLAGGAPEELSRKDRETVLGRVEEMYPAACVYAAVHEYVSQFEDSEE